MCVCLGKMPIKLLLKIENHQPSPSCDLLIKVWLEQRLFYVDMDGSISPMSGIKYWHGPGLINMANPLFNIGFPLSFFIFKKVQLCQLQLCNNMERRDWCVDHWHEKELEAITKWLRDLGLKVNESKTEICLFHRNNLRSIGITLNGITLKSTPHIKFHFQL